MPAMEPASPSRYVSVTPQQSCLTCGQPLAPGRPKRYCSPACKQVGYRRRTQPVASVVATATTPSLPARRSKREDTIYICGQCEQRYLGEQWCGDCQYPCARLGPGGTCPGCDELITIEELLADSGYRP